MNSQNNLVVPSDSREESEDVWWNEPIILYYFRGQAYKLSRNGYLPVSVLSLTHRVQSSCDVLISDENWMFDAINDDTDIYAQPEDMWCLLQNAFQAKIASEILHIDFCDYCSSPLWLAIIARSLFEKYIHIGLTYSQFRKEFLEQCLCDNKNPS